MFQRFDMVEGLKNVDEVECSGRQVEAIQVDCMVSKRRSRRPFVSQRLRPGNGRWADVEARQRPHRETPLRDEAVEMSCAAAQRQNVATCPYGKYWSRTQSIQ